MAAALVVLLGAMVLDVSWQVLSRFLLKNPSSFTEEIARYLLMWIGLLGAAYAFRRRSHLSLDLLMQYAGVSQKKWLYRCTAVCSFLFAASVMVYGGASLMILTLGLEQHSAALGIPVGLVYSCIPISGFLICWFSTEMFIDPFEPEV